jgi:hypothetical protein
MTVLLIHPPVVKPCEPPAGIARLCGALGSHRVNTVLWDANLEGLLALMQAPQSAADRWTRRAQAQRTRHLAEIRRPELYRQPDRYRRAVADLNRLVETAAPAGAVRLSLTNLQDAALSPVRSSDLLQASEQPESSPFYPHFSRRLNELVEKDQPSVVGFSLNFLSQALSTFAMMGFLRRRWPQLSVVLGGGLITSWMRGPIRQNPFDGLVDHLVAGPGESALLSLLGVDRQRTDDRPHPTPDYRELPLSDYLAPGPVLPYSASSGCYWNRCAFCPEKAEGNPYVPVPTARLLEDLTDLSAATEAVLVHLLDNAVSPAVMKALGARPPGVAWYGFARVDRRLADPDFCMTLKRSGCVMLKLGVESGDQTVLDSEHKGVDLGLASAALKNLKKVGIATYVYLLFGTPSETPAAARRTLDFTVGHSAVIDFLNLSIFNLPINAPQARRLDTEMLSDGDLSLYTGFRHPRGWNRARVRQFLDKEFKRHPAVRAILRRNPPLFTSNHAPFFSPGYRSMTKCARRLTIQAASVSDGSSGRSSP